MNNHRRYDLKWIHSNPLVWVTWAAILMMTACAGPWDTVPDRLNAPQWSLIPPKGWMHLSTPRSEMLSKDGPYLQYILVQSKPLDQRFRFTKRTLDPGMLPHEAAQLIVDNLSADPLVRRFDLIENQPAIMDGQAGFRLIYTYRDANGVDIKTIYYGFIFPDQFFNLRYTATRRHYFADQRQAFTALLETLKFSPDLDSISIDLTQK